MPDWVEIERRILEVLTDAEEKTLSTHQIGKRADIHHSTAKKHLKLMEFHKVVERVTDGRITLWTLN